MLKVNVNVVIYSKEDKILNDFKCAFEKESKYFNNNIQTIKETKELKEIEKVDLLIVVFNEKTINCTKILSNKTEKIIIVDLKNELIKYFQLNTIEGIKNKDFRVIAFSIAFGFYNELRNRKGGQTISIFYILCKNFTKTTKLRQEQNPLNCYTEYINEIDGKRERLFL